MTNLNQQTSEAFLVVLGNTERSADEAIALLRRTIPELAGVHISPAKAVTPAGQLQLELQAPAGRLEIDQLTKTINLVGECMFQVDSIRKL